MNVSEDYILDIKYFTSGGKGRMIINMASFFPCSLSKFKDFLKVVDMDYKNREDHKKRMKEHFKWRIEVLTSLIKEKIEEHAAIKMEHFNATDKTTKKKLMAKANRVLKETKSYEYNIKRFRRLYETV